MLRKYLQITRQLTCDRLYINYLCAIRLRGSRFLWFQRKEKARSATPGKSYV